MKVLNLYAGIGGNRKLWTNVDVTAVEYNSEIAAIYKDYFPQDTVIVGDAHQYLIDHYKEFDFIWTSPPCQTHSRSRFWSSKGGMYAVKFPDMKLWEEIIFLQHYAECKWVVENVIPYYPPLIQPTADMERHLFWSNFKITKTELQKVERDHNSIKSELYGFDISGIPVKHSKKQIIRNLVNPDLGLYILEQAKGIMRIENTNQLKLAI